MSEDKHVEDDTEPKSSPTEAQNNSNETPGFKAVAKTDVILPIDKDNAQNKEIVIDVNKDIEVTDDHAVKKYDDKKYQVYGYYGDNIRASRSTWVMYEGAGMERGGGGGSLDYDPSTRNSFVRLVFGIVLAMILVTASVNAIVLIVEELKEFFQDYGLFVALPAMMIMIGLNYAIACSPCSRVFPCNIVCLVLAVICMTIICCYITVRYETRIVFYAVVATTVVVFVCFCLAFTSFDFTAWLIYVVVISAAFGAIAMIASLTMLITGTYMKMVHLGILIVGTLLNVIILTMELQMILGGKAVEIEEDDFLLAAFLLYTSIVDIFLKLVQMIGIFDNL